MLVQEKGTISGSEEFHPKPSEIAEKIRKNIFLIVSYMFGIMLLFTP